MAGGKLYIEPILEELQNKIGELETGMSEIKEAMAEIPAKLDDQIDELRKVVNAASVGITELKTKDGTDEQAKLFSGYNSPVLPRSGSSRYTETVIAFTSNCTGYVHLKIKDLIADGMTSNTDVFSLYAIHVYDNNGVIGSATLINQSLKNGDRVRQVDISSVPVSNNGTYFIKFEYSTHSTNGCKFLSDEITDVAISYDIVNIAAGGGVVFK